MIYLKHYWVNPSGNYLTQGAEVDMRHPSIEGIDVKHWCNDERGVPYCLSVAPDTTIINQPPVGIQVLSKAEWDALVALLPQPPTPEEPDANIDWDRFKQSTVTSPELNALLAQVVGEIPLAVIALPTSIMELKVNNYANFENAWREIAAHIEIPQDLKDQFVALAQSCNLPQRFIDILAA